MKIVATVNEGGMAANVGGGVERRSVVIEFPDETLPPLLRKYFKNEKWASEGPNRYTYTTLEFSLLDESEAES